jgi:hypothetical protein
MSAGGAIPVHALIRLPFESDNRAITPASDPRFGLPLLS